MKNPTYGIAWYVIWQRQNWSNQGQRDEFIFHTAISYEVTTNKYISGTLEFNIWIPKFYAFLLKKNKSSLCLTQSSQKLT